MASVIGTTAQTISNWENGRTAPIPGPVLKNLSSLMQEPADELLFGHGLYLEGED